MKAMKRAGLIAMSMVLLLAQAPLMANAKNTINEKTVSVTKEESDDSISMFSGEKLVLQVRDLAGRILPVDSWSSSNEKVAKVKKVGKTKAKIYAKQGGVAIIEAHIGEAVFKYKIRVNTLMEFPTSNYTVQEGLERHVKIVRASDQEFDISKVSVVVENPEIAEVSVEWSQYSELRLNILGISVGSTKFTIYGPGEKEEITLNATIVKKKKTVKVEEYENATYRLLSIGQTAFDDEYWNQYNYQQSAAGMKDILKKSGYETAVYKNDLSKKGIKKAIENTFKNAKDGDVSVFFYSGPSRAGGLSTIERNGEEDNLEFSELADLLSKVPGKVVVILDFSYSGSVAENFEKAVNAKVVNTFAKANTKSQFTKDKFSVLTSCKDDQYSVTTDYGSLFSQLFAEGVGYFLTSGNAHTAYADMNGDSKLTLYEVWNYTKENLYGYQTPVCYPAKSGIKIVQK